MPANDTSAPSTASIAIATAILSFASGYFFASFSSLFSSSPSSTSKSDRSEEKKSWPNSYDVNIHPDSSDEELMARLGPQPNREVPDSEEDSDAGSDADSDDSEAPSKIDLSDFKGHGNEECKLVLVVRQDLGMGKGKMAAQCSHATLACYTALSRADPAHPLLKRWQKLGQAKIVTQAGSEEELMVLQAQAVSLGLCAQVVHDAGRTQVASGTATVLGVGPGPKGVVDRVTGGLKLL